MARLERVLGCTACSRSLAVDPKSGLVAYPAGSALVLLNPRTQCRAQLLSPGQSQLTCLAWSPCGQFIASGEFGADPKVRVWALRQGNSGGKAETECELGWHRLGISCVSFTPDSEMLVSVGNNHDKQILVWDWRTRRRLAESRLTCQVNAMAQSESGRMFVTVGVRHVKFWYLERGSDGAVLLQGRSAILAEQRNNTFIDCCCASGQRTFALTLSRLLVEFADKRLVGLFQMGAEVPFALSPGAGLLFLGFGDGAIRALDLARMEPVLEFGRPQPLHADVAVGEESGGLMPQKAIEGPNSRFADVHSLVFHAPSGVLTALYSDRSVYHWLLQWPPAKGQRPLQPQRISSQLFHVGPIFDLEAGTGTALPGDSFITAGADETVRFWCLDRVGNGAASLGQSANSMSPELRKVLFLCPEADSLTERPDKNFGGIISDTLESTTGVRCVRLSPGARHLACGRKNGNICVFDLSARGWPRLAEFEAHEGEVLCMDYGGREEAEEGGHGLLLASASRDRLVHVFDARRQYEHLLTLDEHRAPVIWLRFIQNAEEAPLLVSFGSDQQLLSRQLCPMPGGIASLPLARLQLDAVASPGCCVAAQPTTGLLLVGCQDRVLREFEAGTGRLVRTLDAAAQPGIRITKLCLDPSGSVAAALCSDRSVLLLDMDSGDCLAVLALASDCVTGLAFSADCRRLLLVSYSGCISVWRLSAQLHRRMVAKWAAAGSSPQLLDRSASPPAAEDSASQGSAAGADSLLEFGSLLSLQDIASGGGNHQPLSATATNFLNAKQEDDELDSGIGGAGGEGGQLQQRFELKRVHPSEAPLQQVDEAETAAEQQQSTGTTAAAGIPPPMLSSPSGHSPATLGRPQPPPYPGSQLQPHLQLQQQQNSRSMSNLIYSPNGQQQQPTGASVGGRRRWNIGSQQPQQQQQQQQLQQHPQQAVQQQFQNGTLFVGNGQQPLKPFAANGQQLNQHPLTHPPQNFQPRHLHPAQPSAPTSFVGLSPDSQQQRFGISSSVSLNAIRAKLVTADGVGAAECGQQQLSPTPAAVWSSHNPTRNSTSRRYFNGGGNGNAMEQQSCVWTPGGGGGGGLQVKSVAGGLSRRRSSLFNNSAEPGPSSFGQQQNNLLGISHASASPGSSSQTSGTGAADFRPSPESAGGSGGGRRLFQSAQQSAADGAGGARLALSRIKQRRMGGPASDAGGIANGHSEINANNNNHSQQNGNGAQAAPFSSRSRSQSPSQLAMALLAAQQGHNGQQQQQQSQQPRPKAAVSPSGRSAISSSPSSASRYQLRLSSVGSSSRLQQARQRLKKSQENLAAAIEADSFLVAAAGNDQQNEEADMVDNGPLSRSRSIGNLQLARLAEDGGGGHGGGGIGSGTGIGSSPFGGRRRQMAKSVTDLVAEQKMAASSGAEQERLAECRQRLARSIRDIRRISESDLFPDAAASPAQVAVASISANRTPTGEDSVSGSLDSSWHSPGLRLPRRGVQKKLDRQWTPSNRASLGQTATAADSPAAQQSAANPLFFHSTLPRRTSIEGGAGPTSAPNTALRSVSSLMASSSRSPRSNYLAHKLAGQGSSSGGNSAESAGSAVGHQQLQQQSGNRSLSAELGTLATGLANGGQFGSAGAKRMALHAQECIREMQQACDKLLGTRQLIQLEPAIGAEEKRQLLASINLAVAAFAQRLTMEEGQADQQQQQQ